MEKYIFFEIKSIYINFAKIQIQITKTLHALIFYILLEKTF